MKYRIKKDGGLVITFGTSFYYEHYKIGWDYYEYNDDGSVQYYKQSLEYVYPERYGYP